MQRANSSAGGNDPVPVSVWAWRPIRDACTVARPLQAQLLFFSAIVWLVVQKGRSALGYLSLVGREMTVSCTQNCRNSLEQWF